MGLRCAICGGACRPFLGELFDDRHGYPGRFALQECGDCGHRQLDAHFSPADLATLYSEYYPRRALPPDAFVPHREARGLPAWLDGAGSSAFRWVPRGVRVLDIGSGIGQALAYHRERGCDAWGVDADENARAIAGRHGLNVRIGTFDPGMFDAGSFDYVTLDQVIEHTVDPVPFLRGAASLLRDGGHAVLSTPNSRGIGATLFGRRWIHWHAPYHLHHFSRDSLRRTGRAAGLDIVTLRTLTSSAWLHYQWLHLATLPRPGEISAFWDPAKAGRGIPRGAQHRAARIHGLRLNHLATRAADAVGLGDNFLCILRKAA
jgi:2-polyprenyl-3-methyl-5-hydroxy-6-metoxy-1,4-benzoquinol methylase